MGHKGMLGTLMCGAVATTLLMPNVATAQSTADRVSASEKGSVLYYAKVELRWNAAGALIQDTFIDITNDHPEDVIVQLYFVDGDRWNYLDNAIELTGNEPTYWSAATGLPKGVSPFTALGQPIPDPDGSSDSVLRGFIVAFAANETTNCQIRWNHLKGDACLVNYRDGYAWEYNAYAFAAKFDAANSPANGEQVGADCGQIDLDGTDYVEAYKLLIMDFYAVGSAALSGPSTMVTVDTDLTLGIVDNDFRQEGDGVYRTKASILVWNMNETKFSELHRCITCWDQTLLSNYGTPNHFLLTNLHTDKGKAVIDAIESEVCDVIVNFPDRDDFDCDVTVHPDDLCARDVALLGVVAKFLSFGTAGTVHGAAGTNLHGSGSEATTIYYDPSGGTPPEATEPTSPSSGKTWFKAIDSQLTPSKKSIRR